VLPPLYEGRHTSTIVLIASSFIAWDLDLLHQKTSRDRNQARNAIVITKPTLKLDQLIGMVSSARSDRHIVTHNHLEFNVVQKFASSSRLRKYFADVLKIFVRGYFVSISIFFACNGDNAILSKFSE
jgi:hypothetical protein